MNKTFLYLFFGINLEFLSWRYQSNLISVQMRDFWLFYFGKSQDTQSLKIRDTVPADANFICFRDELDFLDQF